MNANPLRPPPRADFIHDDDPRRSGADLDLALRHVLPVVGRQGRGSDTAIWLLGTALVVVLGAATFWSMSHTRAEHATPPAVANSVQPLAAATPVPLPVVPQAAITPLVPDPARPSPALDTGRVQTGGNPLATPALVYNAAPVIEPAPVAEPASPGKAPVPAAPSNAGDDFAARLGATGSAGASAAQAFNPRTTVAQGTLIPAVLETAIDTDVPGYARAIVSADVRSFDGSRVLVPRSSRLIGQYKSGLQAGQRRVYVIWTRLIRPDGVAVALGSPGTGYSGESGLGGKVDTHFFERFGSAMLLTVMSGLGTIGSGNTSVVIAGSGQSAAAAAVGQSGQIGPTVRVHPGEPIRVFTARDLDFTRVETP